MTHSRKGMGATGDFHIGPNMPPTAVVEYGQAIVTLFLTGRSIVSAVWD